MMGPRAFGTMWRITICIGETPIDRATSTNNSFFSIRTCPRATRAMVSHDVAPRAMSSRNKLLSKSHQNHNEQNIGQRIKDVYDSHHHVVHPSTEVSGHRTVGDTDDE